jgi:hypothetical protein
VRVGAAILVMTSITKISPAPCAWGGY